MLAGLCVAALALLGLLGHSGADVHEASLHVTPERAPPEGPAPRATPAAAPPSPEPSPAGEAPADDPQWPSRLFVVPAGTGPVTGAELLDALEASGSWRFTADEPALLAEVRAHAFEQAGRGSQQPYAALAGWLKEAGWLLEPAWPRLRLVRRSDRPEGER